MYLFHKYRLYVIVGLVFLSHCTYIYSESTLPASLEKAGISISVDAFIAPDNDRVEVAIKNLSKASVYLNKLSLENPKILVYSKVGTSYTGQFVFKGLSTGGLKTALQESSANNKIDIIEVKASETFIWQSSIKESLNPFIEKLAARSTKSQKLRVKLEFSHLLRPAEQMNLEKPHNINLYETFFTPWIVLTPFKQ